LNCRRGAGHDSGLNLSLPNLPQFVKNTPKKISSEAEDVVTEEIPLPQTNSIFFWRRGFIFFAR
jgi:hypothetical protein